MFFKWNNFIVFENHTFALQKGLNIKLNTVKHTYKKYKTTTNPI